MLVSDDESYGQAKLSRLTCSAVTSYYSSVVTPSLTASMSSKILILSLLHN